MSTTRYSKEIEGSRGNYFRPVTFDFTTGGYVGISQMVDEPKDNHIERVLLTKKQVDELLKFLGVKRGRK